MSQSLDKKDPKTICLFLCGDVMTGRGVDQIMPVTCDPMLYEPYVRNAKHYVQLAEEFNGPIGKPVDYAYIWGEALQALAAAAPDVRIINLETSVTTHDRHWPGKGIHYRMHPKNVKCLTAAGIDCCVLANNHVLDWGLAGLEETTKTLHRANIATAGAGSDKSGACKPAELVLAKGGRIWVFAYGLPSSGVDAAMAAGTNRPGVNYLADLSAQSVTLIRQQVQAVKRSGDLVVVSLHWGGNWGYAIPDEQRQFAHQLIDSAGVDVIHGHSSHHVKGSEVYHDKPVLYGCGDLLNDYEGIPAYESYRDDLGLMYLVSMDRQSGKLRQLEMVPTQIKRFQLHNASKEDRRWLQTVMNREGKHFNTSVEEGENNRLVLRW